MVRFKTVKADYRALRDEWCTQQHWPDPGGTKSAPAVRVRLERKGVRAQAYGIGAKKWWNCNPDILADTQRTPHSIYWKMIGQIGGYPPRSIKIERVEESDPGLKNFTVNTLRN